MYIKRKIEGTILRYLENKEILAILGPRQCGKTTVMKRIFESVKKENKLFLTFEDREALSLFEKDIKEFARKYIQPNSIVFIDEFQYAKHGGKLLKYLYDMHETKIIISGSSATDLTIKAVRFLVGRIFLLEMYPFDFYEFILARDERLAALYLQKTVDLKKHNNAEVPESDSGMLKKYYEEYLLWGGYPRVVLARSEEEKREVLKNIYDTYFLRDVKGLLSLADDYKFGNLMKGLALQIGNMIEYKELSHLSELSFKTLKKYFNFLSKTYICEFILPLHTNKRKEIVKNRKVYFFDTGLRNHIVNNFYPLSERSDNGALLENAFWMQAIKREYVAQYWRDKKKNEVDFVIDIGEGKMAAIEIKNNKHKCRELPPAFSKNYKNVVACCAYMEDKNKSYDCPTIHKIFIPLF